MGPAGPWGGGCSWREKLRSKEVTGPWQRSILSPSSPAAYVATLQEPSDPCSGWRGLGGWVRRLREQLPRAGSAPLWAGGPFQSKLAGGRTDNTGAWFTLRSLQFTGTYYTLVYTEADSPVWSKNPLEILHTRLGLCQLLPQASCLPPAPVQCTWGWGGQRTDAASPTFPGDPGSGVEPNRRLLGSQGLVTVGGTSPYSQVISQGLSPAQFRASWCVSSACPQMAATEQQAPRPESRLSLVLSGSASTSTASQWTLISPACSGGRSPAATFLPVPLFSPHLWEVINLCIPNSAQELVFKKQHGGL